MQNMGKARVQCKSGCTCKPTTLDASWVRRESLQQIHSFKVSEHPTCRIRVTILAGTEGHKVRLRCMPAATGSGLSGVCTACIRGHDCQHQNRM